MIQFTIQLKKEIDAKIEQIECSEISMITKASEASYISVVRDFLLPHDITIRIFNP